MNDSIREEALSAEAQYKEAKEGIQMVLALLKTAVDDNGEAVGAIIGSIMTQVFKGIKEANNSLLQEDATAKLAYIGTLRKGLVEQGFSFEQISTIIAAILHNR